MNEDVTSMIGRQNACADRMPSISRGPTSAMRRYIDGEIEMADLVMP